MEVFLILAYVVFSKTRFRQTEGIMVLSLNGTPSWQMVQAMVWQVPVVEFSDHA